MNREEAAKLLALVALGDNRQTTTEIAAYWHGLLPDIRFDDAVQAVAIHRRESTEYLQPAHIIRTVRAERAKRIEAANIVYEPITGETGREFASRIQALEQAAGNGQLGIRSIGRALEAGPRVPEVPAELQAAIDARREARAALLVACPYCHATPNNVCTIGAKTRPSPGFMHPKRLEAFQATRPRLTLVTNPDTAA